MKTENYIVNDYNLNIISINQLINNSVERIIKMYCLKINFTINYKTRDTKKLFFHFIADNVLLTLCKYPNVKNILHFTNFKTLSLLPNDCVNLINYTVRKFVAKFKLCTYFTDTDVNTFSENDIYAIKQLSDSCSIKKTNISNIKKFLLKNEFLHLSEKLTLDTRVKHIIMVT